MSTRSLQIVLACLLALFSLGVAPVMAGATTAEDAAAQAELLPDEEDYAAVGESADPVQLGGEGDVGAALGQLLVALLLVAACALGLAWVVKRLGGARRILNQQGRHLSVIETVSLGLKRSVSLVRVGDTVLVLGQSEQQVTTLATLEAGAVLGAGAGTGTGTAAPGASTASATQRETSGGVPGDEAAVASFQDRLRSLLGGKRP
ncbi:MAG: flagellar biosynthetic protein FliO [Planctomycetota bacterium]